MLFVNRAMKSVVVMMALGAATVSPVAAANFNFMATFGDGSVLSGSFEGTEVGQQGGGVFSVDQLQMLSLEQNGKVLMLWDSSDPDFGTPAGDPGDVPFDFHAGGGASQLGFNKMDNGFAFCTSACNFWQPGADNEDSWAISFRYIEPAGALFTMDLAAKYQDAGFRRIPTISAYSWTLKELPDTTSAPEPATAFSLIALGLGAVAARRKLASSRTS